ncbi:MAG: hypothetical protein ACREP9_06235, partial [Candidatus Dormibacteraceae bacterium]
DMHSAAAFFPEAGGRERLERCLATLGSASPVLSRQPKVSLRPPKQEVYQVVLKDSNVGALRSWNRNVAFSRWASDEIHWEAQAAPVSDGFSYKVSKGGEILGQGRLENPTPQRFANLLVGLAPSRIDHLELIIRSHPDYKPALRQLVQVLVLRMPNSALEPELASWVRLLDEAPEIAMTKSWSPDPLLWESWAPYECAHFDSRLGEFPTDRTTWKAWLFWNERLAKPQSVLNEVQMLPHSGNWISFCASLPAEVINPLVSGLWSQGRMEDIKALAYEFKFNPQGQVWIADRGVLSSATENILSNASVAR